MKLRNLTERTYFGFAVVASTVGVLLIAYAASGIHSVPVKPEPTVAELAIKVEKLVAETNALVEETRALLAKN